MPVVMGTAGHVDHGKTALVKALTGMDCDRLEEEKRRGITIELGFAHMALPDGSRLGIVDVPGHERFIKNMVAGAAGIDFVLLVVAADDGVMEQTREHLEICSLLGITHGLVALTKTDLVDEDWLALVQEDLERFLQGSFLEGAPVVPVSARAGQGIEELKAQLAEQAQSARANRRADLLRLPVDRVFTMRGHGTVVTGTMVSGAVKEGDEVTIFPKGLTSRVRGLQSHGESSQDSQAGRRTALNLQGLEVADLERGDIIARSGTLFPSLAWDVELSCLPSSPRALKHRTEIHFHHGARETLARLYFPDRTKLAPGETCLCRVRFTSPLPAVRGDRVVVRAFSPLRTVAGGWVINPLPPEKGRLGKQLEAMAELTQATGPDLIEAQVRLTGSRGTTKTQLAILAGMEAKALDKAISDLLAKNRIFLVDREDQRVVSAATVEAMAQEALAFLEAFHAKDPLKQGLARAALSPAWDKETSPKLAHFLIERMLKTNQLAQDQDLLHLPGHTVSLASDQEGLKQTLLDAYSQAGLTPPNLKDVLAPLDLTHKQAAPVLKLLVDQG
ncbi:MAG: selenocysteine-specific translation elongation factor, partial [Desulfovibrio sp.]